MLILTKKLHIKSKIREFIKSHIEVNKQTRDCIHKTCNFTDGQDKIRFITQVNINDSYINTGRSCVTHSNYSLYVNLYRSNDLFNIKLYSLYFLILTSGVRYLGRIKKFIYNTSLMIITRSRIICSKN